MNRQDIIRRVMLREAMAAALMADARADRDMLAEDARAELKEQGTAPTWRLPDLATVTLPVTRDSVYVRDADAFALWVARRHPSEILLAVRPAFQTALLHAVQHDGEHVYDREGTEVPGLAVRPGGAPGALSLRPAAEAKAVLAQAARVLVDRLPLDGPIVLAEPANG